MSVVLDAVVPALDAHGAAVVDGGTDPGVMRLIAHAWRNARFPLVSVAASGTAAVSCIRVVPAALVGESARQPAESLGRIRRPGRAG